MFFLIRKYLLAKKAKLFSSGILDYFLKNKIIPDLVLIDGRYRVLCGLYLFKYLKNLLSKNRNKITILIDDYINRKEYFILRKFYNISIIENMALLKIKKIKIQDKTFNKLINKFALDYR
jgi:hypothetical protein